MNRTDISSLSSNEAYVEFQNEIDRLRSELERVREGAGVDIANAQADVVAKNREIGRLKALLTQQEEDSPEHKEVRALLELWRDEVRGKQKGPKPNIAADSKRATRVRWALRKYGVERTRKAILGCQFDDWAMGRLRKTQGRVFNDVAKHILADEESFEKFELLYEQNTRPTLGGSPLQIVPDLSKPKKPGLVVERLRRIDRREAPPIDTVLHELTMHGCEWRAGQADTWSAQCPAHEDSSPSLAIHRKPDGMVLLNCFAGCETDDVLDALGLEWCDLWERCEDDHQALDYRSPAERQQRIPAHLRQAMRQILARDEGEMAA